MFRQISIGILLTKNHSITKSLHHNNMHNNLNMINLIVSQHIENNNTNMILLPQLLFMSQLNT